MYPILSPQITFFMAKFLMILFFLYVIYYAGNIVYDLFIKKDTSTETEESDVFSITEFEEENRGDITNVGIEDVENLNTPKSFNKREFPINEEPSEERQDIEVLRKRFESEQNIDFFDPTVLNQINRDTDNHSRTLENEEREIPEKETKMEEKATKEKFYDLLNLAATTVQMISNNNGHKVYNAL